MNQIYSITSDEIRYNTESILSASIVKSMFAIGSGSSRAGSKEGQIKLTPDFSMPNGVLHLFLNGNKVDELEIKKMDGGYIITSLNGSITDED